MASERFDVVVVGGGLAGLSVAHRLPASARVLLVEGAERLGGRVRTVPAPFATQVDLGACFAFNPALLPPLSAAPVCIEERGPLCVEYAGAVASGPTAWSCLEAACLSDAVRSELDGFRRGDRSFAEMGEESARLLAALLHQIHPGDLRDYTRERQQDAMAPLYPDHHASGNGALVDAYARALGPNVEVRLGRKVRRISERGADVDVTYEDPDSCIAQVVTGRAVVLATSAQVARSLVAPSEPACKRLLAAVRYGTYTVVAIVAHAPALRDFRFMVTPDRRVSLVMQQASADRKVRTLLCYYAGRSLAFAAARDDRSLVRDTVAQVCALEVGLTPERVVFTAVQRWELAGTVITPELDAARREGTSRATARVFIAGDYACRDGWGYGMDDAVASGVATAELVRSAILTSR